MPSIDCLRLSQIFQHSASLFCVVDDGAAIAECPSRKRAASCADEYHSLGMAQFTGSRQDENLYLAWIDVRGGHGRGGGRMGWWKARSCIARPI